MEIHVIICAKKLTGNGTLCIHVCKNCLEMENHVNMYTGKMTEKWTSCIICTEKTLTGNGNTCVHASKLVIGSGNLCMHVCP